ncbi:MAG: molybdopterin-dependent oxidoreductase [Clostridiales bacterium]|nr:molybdopterin-dependent oxidoreductase [Clostridiales bacterium]
MKKILMCICAFLLISFVLLGCAEENGASPSENMVNEPPDVVSSATKERYRENEIREYQGARLDPAIGPRDNSIKGVQNVDIDKYSLSVSGLVDKPVSLEYGDVLKLDAYQRKITLYCVEGWDATILWEGVLLKDIMDIAGIKKEANTVIFHAVDGYTTSLPLEEIITNQLILAYSANGLELPPEMGYPFIVVAEDKWGYKWARWVSEIELSDNPNYRGYWEQQGYSIEGTIVRTNK